MSQRSFLCRRRHVFNSREEVRKKNEQKKRGDKKQREKKSVRAAKLNVAAAQTLNQHFLIQNREAPSHSSCSSLWPTPFIHAASRLFQLKIQISHPLLRR